MDSLDNLPVDKGSMGPEDAEVMAQIFGSPPSTKSGEESTGIWDKDKWKTVAILSVVYIVLSNSWIQGALSKVPYFGGNEISQTVLSFVVFFIVAAAVIFLI